MDPKELWSKTVPSPPGWWEIHGALEALAKNQPAKARELAKQCLVENERWKRDVKELGFSPWAWRYKLDEKHSQTFSPEVLVTWVCGLADDLEKKEK